MSRAAGTAAERRALAHLHAQGLTPLAENFHSRGGEIDLIMSDCGVTVFVEVRQRTSARFGGAAASVTASKRRRLIHAARLWMARHGETPGRFDVVTIDGDGSVEWIKDAFAADGSW